MRIDCHAGKTVSRETMTMIGRYRHDVFVRSLGWNLPADEEGERDEFDTADAAHLVAVENDQVVGYARLLPTTCPYLLGTHFIDLVSGGLPPRSPRVWELSRYAAESACDAATRTRVGKRLLLAAVRFAASHGAEQLICCTTVAIERLARRWGVDMQRLGAPRPCGAELLIAARIDCSEHTCAVLAQEAVPRDASLRLRRNAEPWHLRPTLAMAEASN